VIQVSWLIRTGLSVLVLSLTGRVELKQSVKAVELHAAHFGELCLRLAV
jgi:hypothetical protein